MDAVLAGQSGVFLVGAVQVTAAALWIDHRRRRSADEDPARLSVDGRTISCHIDNIRPLRWVMPIGYLKEFIGHIPRLVTRKCGLSAEPTGIRG